MGLTCSVLGHRFGDPERVEEREEQGSEVILTISEVKRCERCAHEAIVSESKEVTANRPERSEPAPDHEDVTSDAETQTPDGVDVASDERAQPAATDHAWEADESIDTDVEDDGIILEDEPTERAHGQWPPRDQEDDERNGDTDDERTEEGEFTAWPEAEGEDEGYSAAAHDEDDEDAESEVAFSGLNPEVSNASGDTGAEVLEPTGDAGSAESPVGTPNVGTTTQDEIEAATESAPASAGDDGFTRADSITPPIDSGADDRETEYFCPRCEFVRRSVHASVRAGDICPSCHKGYLATRHVD